MDISKLFGLPLDQDMFDIDKHASLVGISDVINNNKTIKKLSNENGKNHLIVQVAKRQTVLKYFKSDLGAALLAFDPLYYKKEVKTASETDRRYNAEEKLLEYTLVVATGKTLKKLHNESFKPDIRALRDTESDARYDRYWSILADQTRSTVTQYQDEIKQKALDNCSANGASAKGKGQEGFWSKLFR